MTDAGADQAGDPGIHALALPTPFLVGRVNCYLIEDEPLTLVDTGPNSGMSLDELARGLAALGHEPADLGLIVLTHQHLDHVGLAQVLQRRSGAEVAAWHELTPYLARFSASAADDDAFSAAVMERHGVPADVVATTRAVSAAFRAFGSSPQITRPLHDGDRLTLRDRTLRVWHRPGHSPSDIVLHDEDRGLLLGGDHLLSKVSSNPTLSRALSGSGDVENRPRALMDYIGSLRTTREMTHVTTVLGGHGPPVEDHVALIDERLRMHDRRARRILGMLEEGPATAWELATRMWGNVAVTQSYLTISEILGHMDVLVVQGAVREDRTGEVVHFQTA